MLFELPQDQSEKARAIFAPLAYNLTVESILAGKTPAKIWVDDLESPGAAFTWFKHRWFLAGEISREEFNTALSERLRRKFFAAEPEEALEVGVIHLSSAAWEGPLKEILDGQSLQPYERLFFQCNALAGDWRKWLPVGFRLLPVEAGLVQQAGLENLEALREEMCSERSSVEDFLAHSFGVASQTGNTLAGWCLSEYNTGERCEVGVGTLEPYQRQGLGTAMTLRLVEAALERGYRQVGWHCWKGNQPSAALAYKAGFQLVQTHRVFFLEIRAAKL